MSIAFAALAGYIFYAVYDEEEKKNENGETVFWTMIISASGIVAPILLFSAGWTVNRK